MPELAKLTQFKVNTCESHKSGPSDAGHKNYEIDCVLSAPGYTYSTPLRPDGSHQTKAESNRHTGHC